MSSKVVTASLTAVLSNSRLEYLVEMAVRNGGSQVRVSIYFQYEMYCTGVVVVQYCYCIKKSFPKKKHKKKTKKKFGAQIFFPKFFFSRFIPFQKAGSLAFETVLFSYFHLIVH